MVMASNSNRKTLCVWLIQVSLGCLIVEAGFISEIFRGKAETSKLKSQIAEPLLSEIGSKSLVQSSRGKLEHLSSSKGYLVDETGHPLVLNVKEKDTLENIFEGVTRKYFYKVPTSSKNPIEPSKLMAEIIEIVKEVKNKKFVSIAETDREENREKLDNILSQRLEEASENYREIMNLSNENRGVGKNKAYTHEQIEEAMSKWKHENIAEAGRSKETPNELLKVKDTIQSATRYILDQRIVRRDDISKTLEAMGQHFYDEAWFHKNILIRSRKEEDFDPFFSSIKIKDYIINHTSLKQHRVILKALPPRKLRSSILKFLLSYSELLVSHYGNQMSDLEKISMNKILNDLIDGKTLHNKIWESAFSGAVSDFNHYNSRMIYHLILYHAYGFNNPDDVSNIITISERMRDFKYALCIQQRILNFYRSKRFMGYGLKITSPYKNYIDEISRMRLENNRSKTTVVDNFNQLKIKVSEVGFQKSVLAKNLAEWQRSVERARWWVLMHLNEEKTDFYVVETSKHSDNNIQWEKSEIIRLTKLYNKIYFWRADYSLESSISNWLKEIKNEIFEAKKKNLISKDLLKFILRLKINTLSDSLQLSKFLLRNNQKKCSNI